MRKTRLKVKKMEITELQREEENAWDAYVYNSYSPKAIINCEAF